MFKMRFIAIFLCLTTVFATFAGVSFAESGADEETIVIENGKVVSGNSELVDSGFIVIADEEESSADEGEDSAQPEEPKEELSADAKLQYILGNIGSFFKSETTQSTPEETPNAVSPSVPTESEKATVSAEDFTIPAISTSISSSRADTSYYRVYYGSSDNSFYLYSSDTGMYVPISTRSNLLIAFTGLVEQNRQYGALSGQVVEMTYADGQENTEVGFGNRGSGLLAQSYNFHAQGGTIKIIGSSSKKFVIDPNYTTPQYLTAPTFMVDNGGTLELKNVLIRDSRYLAPGGAGTGAAIRVTGGTVRLENVEFENCYNDCFDNSKGGAIYVSGTSTITMKNCTISNSFAGSGGAIYVADGATPVSGNYVLQMENTVITNCYSDSKPTSATDSLARGGGGIYIGNIASGKKVSIKGGTISSTRSAYSSNSYGANGGGIFVKGANTTLEMDGVTLDKCYSGLKKDSTTYTTAGGGGMYIYQSTVKMKDCTISGCYTIGADGGGVFVNSGKLTMIGTDVKDGQSTSIIQSCEAKSSGNGGGIRVYRGKIALKNTDVVSNTAYNNGGGLYLDGNTSGNGDIMEFNNVKINGNTATNAGSGGLLVQDTNVNFTGNNEINNNTAKTWGGAMVVKTSNNNAYCTVNVNTTDNGSTAINDNQATNSGGGVHVSSVGLRATFDMKGGTINNNTSATSGGGIVSQGIVRLDGTTLSGNESNNNGGGIALSNGSDRTHSEAHLINAIIEGNRAVNGGGIHVTGLQHDKLEITGCTIGGNEKAKGNIATTYGGGIYVSGVTSFAITNTNIINNTAIQGGGLYAISDTVDTTGSIEGCNIEANEASGVFLSRGNNSITVNVGSYTANSVTTNTTIKGNTLSSSDSHHYGGAGICCVNGVNLNLNSGTIISGNVNSINKTGTTDTILTDATDTRADGGGVAMIASSSSFVCGTLTVQGGVLIENNVATYGDGGGIFLEDGTGTLNINTNNGALTQLVEGEYATKSTFIKGNVAGNEALDYQEEDPKKAVANKRGGNGGGVYVHQGKIQVTGTATIPVVFEGNHALGGSKAFGSRGHGGGGMMLWEAVPISGDNVKLTYVNFIKNASRFTRGDGGGVYFRNVNFSLESCLFDGNMSCVDDEGNKEEVLDGSGAGLTVINIASDNTIKSRANINNCYFKENKSNGYGGAADFINGVLVTITNTTFDSNKGNKGGGVCFYDTVRGRGSASLDNVYFGNNSTWHDAGGGIFMEGYKVTLQNTYIGWLKGENGEKVAAGNTAAYHGGGMYVNYSAELILSGSTGNIANDTYNVDISNNISRAGDGGGVHFDRTWGKNDKISRFVGVTLTNNKAAFNGGAISVGRYVDLYNSTTIYPENAYVTGDGKIIEIVGCVFTGNSADRRGGALYASDINTTIREGTQFKNNKAGQGGAVYIYDSGYTTNLASDVINIGGGFFDGNKAQGFTDATNSANSLSGDGGAIYFNGARGCVYSLNCINNEAANNGGAIYIGGNNTYGYYGIGLVNFGISPDATKGNKAKNGNGGAICAVGGKELVVARGGVYNNTAEGSNSNQCGYGGGVYVSGVTNTIITKDATAYTKNHARSDFTNSIDDYDTIQVPFLSNSAERGGAMYLNGNATVEYVNVSENTSTSGSGGGIWIHENLTVAMNGTNTINGNSSAKYGGGIFIRSGTTLTINNDKNANHLTCIKYNKSLGDSSGGGGVHVASGAFFTMNYGVITNNDASLKSDGTLSLSHGGGLDVTGGTAILSKVVIMNNEAGSNGGGVSVSGGSATLTDCYIVKNEANGTGTYTTTNGLTVDAVTGVGGGVAVFNSGTFTFEVTNESGAIYDNTATVAASDVFANGSTNISLTIPAAADMDINGATLNGVTIPAFDRDGNNNGKWWEDYMNDDAKYKEGLFGDPAANITGYKAERYADSAISIRAFVNTTEKGTATQYSNRYVNDAGRFVSIIFEVQKYNVGTITITAPSNDGVTNQRFLFEVKGDPTNGEDFTLSVSLVGGESVTITDLLPGTYTITQRTDWSWRFDYKDVTITGVESNVGTNEGNGVVKITISGTMRDEAHKAVYDNNKTQNKWLSHNSQCEKNVATLPVTAFFDMAEAKKGYVI